jgi:hypothetical protein
LTETLECDPIVLSINWSDNQLAGRARLRGCELVRCAGAIVWKRISGDKLCRRHVYSGVLFVAATTTTFVHFAVRPMEIWLGLRWMAIGSAQVAKYALIGCLLLPGGHQRWLDVLANVANGLGKMPFHAAIRVRAYRLKN